ncbi:hypothetical protein KC19_VG193200 [Ceratodon purpureus]|uniref:Reverse transcriptase zinc-binding domain-containing protein n=1 Tax=Ceratodon purpureus TaxID=3225 RepID=A0A8T0HSV4_CERPU|nr:hypothetical protein KC19_VG193200 [Ceratodon purpureus]
MDYFTLPLHQSHKGSKIWNRVVAAWEKMLPEVSSLEPQCFEEFLGCSFWWNEYAPIIGAGFSRARAGELHARGLRRVRDAWHQSQIRFLTGTEVADRYAFTPLEFGAWESALLTFKSQWGGFQSGHAEYLKACEFAGWFRDAEDALPLYVAKWQEGLRIPLRNQGQVTSWIALDFPMYTVRERTRCLTPVDDDRRFLFARIAPNGSGLGTPVTGLIRKVRVVEIEQSQRKTKASFYYGRINLLDFDPCLIKFRDNVSFMSYTTKHGRALLRRHHWVPNLARKWTGILPDQQQSRWTTVWSKERVVKEDGLMWSAWNKALTVNEWRGQFNATIDRNCPTCSSGAVESILHRFSECDNAQKAWHWATHIINLLAPSSPPSQPWRQFNWKQTIFSSRIPQKFKRLDSDWASLPGVGLWTIWLCRTDVVFNGIVWPDQKTYQKIWLGILDYGRVAWQKLQKRILLLIWKDPGKAAKARGEFINQWCSNSILASYSPLEDKVQWALAGPLDSYRPLFRGVYNYNLIAS